MRGSVASPGLHFGDVTTAPPASDATSGGTATGRKRPLVRLRCTLDAARIVDVFGEDAVTRVPASYSLTLDAPNGTRILTFSESRGFSFAGVVAQTGNMVPDPADPAYAGYVDHRRQRDLSAQANRKGTLLARDSDALRHGASLTADASSAAAARGGAAPALTIPRVSTIYALFEHGAYWSLHDMARATGKREVRAGGRMGLALLLVLSQLRLLL